MNMRRGLKNFTQIQTVLTSILECFRVTSLYFIVDYNRASFAIVRTGQRRREGLGTVELLELNWED